MFSVLLRIQIEHDLAILFTQLIRHQRTRLLGSQHCLGQTSKNTLGLLRRDLLTRFQIVGGLAKVASHTGSLILGFLVGWQWVRLGHGNLK
jgi:hypothetical protein